MLEQNRRTWMSAQEMVHTIHPLYLGSLTALRVRRLTYSFQPVDDNTSISGLVDNVLTEVGHLESRASKMDIDDLLKCVNRHADYLLHLTLGLFSIGLDRLLSAFHDVGIHFA